MSEVTEEDGCGEKIPEVKHGEHSITVRYEYKDGYYDRTLREFYGYASVNTIFADESFRTDEYYNNEYYLKGCLRSSKFSASNGTILSKTNVEYLKAPSALPEKQENWSFEKNSFGTEGIYNSSEYEYDGYGNCIKVTEKFGEERGITAEISYVNADENQWIVSLPCDIRVWDLHGILLRYRRGEYDSKGSLVKLYQHYNKDNATVNSFEYDTYGNLKSITDSLGATLSYEYDKVENMFTESVSQQGFGTDTYTSSIKYDVSKQTKKSETDCNGNTLRYEYDKWQRVIEIRTAYDTGTTPSVSYEYCCPDKNADGIHELWY